MHKGTDDLISISLKQQSKNEVYPLIINISLSDHHIVKKRKKYNWLLKIRTKTNKNDHFFQIDKLFFTKIIGCTFIFRMIIFIFR